LVEVEAGLWPAKLNAFKSCFMITKFDSSFIAVWYCRQVAHTDFSSVMPTFSYDQAMTLGRTKYANLRSTETIKIFTRTCCGFFSFLGD
jgi:hypothetical protein